MKYLFTTYLIAFSSLSHGQRIKEIENRLIDAFSKIDYWRNSTEDDQRDSLKLSNDNFESLLLKFTSSNPQTLDYKFKNLADSGLTINTSQDNLFRIYSWNTEMGGTMRFYRNVFQFKGNGKVYSKTLMNYQVDDDSNPDCIYLQIDDIISNNKKYYITLNMSVGSSALYYHSVKIFSIENSYLIDTAKLIRTKTGMKNEIGYGVDTHQQNEDTDLEIMYIKYDKKKKILYLPLLNADGKITHKNIKYKFNGHFFQKV